MGAGGPCVPWREQEVALGEDPVGPATEDAQGVHTGKDREQTGGAGWPRSMALRERVVYSERKYTTRSDFSALVNRSVNSVS